MQSVMYHLRHFLRVVDLPGPGDVLQLSPPSGRGFFFCNVAPRFIYAHFLPPTGNGFFAGARIFLDVPGFVFLPLRRRLLKSSHYGDFFSIAGEGSFLRGSYTLVFAQPLRS